VAIIIVVVVVLIVTSKAARNIEQVKAQGRRSLIPLLIILVLVGLALAGGHH
jgi:hypothetical protein